MICIDKLITYNGEKLQEIFGNVVEKYPEIVKDVFSGLKFQNVDELCETFADKLETLSLNEKLKILKLHPILAGASADKDELTLESTEEQNVAGLKSLEVEKKSEFNTLNSRYLGKFGFPFVICARENKAAVMMEQIKIRLENDIDKEITTGINEVKKICKLRILDLIKDI